MDRQSSTTRSDLEHMLINETAEPKALPLSLLGEITDGFSDEREIGDGGFATVYKGMLGNRAVAVKRLSNTHMHEKEFHREVECLMMVKHKNVVRFLGYCADTQGSMERYNGKLVMADVQQRLLCFEYVPKGSLHEYISDASRGLDWRNRYRIIKGIVEGLHYLHIKKIVHLDLKPANILLDDNMVPKIADFGLSRCFDEQQSQLIATKIGGTFGYVAPEFGNGVITRRFDLYSLGVIIIEILAGEKGYHAVENVLESWRERLEISSGHTQFDQVRVCAQIGIECTENNPSKRPLTQQIIDRLEKTENIDGSVETIGWTRSLTLQEETASSELHHDTPTVIQETSTEDSLLSWSSYRTKSVEMHDIAIPIQLALTKIKFFSQHHIHMDKNADLPEKIEQIAMELTVMYNVIEETGVNHLINKVVKGWLRKVWKLAYHVEDVMDKYLYHNLQREQDRSLTKFFNKGSNYALVFNETVNAIDNILKEIKQIIKLKEKCFDPFQLIPDEHPDTERQRAYEYFPELVQDEDLVGVEGSRLNLTGWLYSEVDEQDSTLITVSGMGGLGKTTLVTNVYQREKIRFSVHAWIIVSQTYNVEDLLKKLLRKIGYTEQAQLSHMDSHDLKEKVKEKLKGKKCLIVLDDVWDKDAYTKIQEAFHGLQESRIIITTRKKHVATLASPTRRLELQPLGEADALNLFCRTAFCNRKGNECPSELMELANSISARCQGLPLVILSIGSMMSSRQLTVHAWEQTFNQFWSELTKIDNVKAILSLSYYDLPGDLRNCFLYCSLFPEDYLMLRESLVWLWVAEGFVDTRENNTPEDVAEENLMELIHRNMLEVVENDELGRVSICKMHNIMRVLALSIAKEARFVSANDSGAIMVDGEVRRLSTYKWKDNSRFMSIRLFPHLRTIISLATISPPTGMLSSILSESSFLTVLELQDSDITEVPASIGNLFNLRYIGLRRTRIKSIPESIENLSNLLILDIKLTKIKKLPHGISKVKKLRHLLVDRFADETESEFRYFIGVQPPKQLSKLVELQTLETVAASMDLAKQLEKLRKLESVWIGNISAANCGDLFATLSNMPLLSSLLLSAVNECETLCFETLEPTSTRLHKLIIRGQWAQGTLECPIFLDHGKYLKYLALSWSQFVEDPLLQLAPLVPNLTYLSLNKVISADTLFLYAGCFPKLKILVLKNMLDVSELEIEDGALPCIEGLYIVSMKKLFKVPEGIECLRSLKKLWLLDLHPDFKTRWDRSEMHKKMQYVPELKI